MKVELVSREASTALKRWGKHISPEWVCQVGVEANHLFAPHFTQS